MVAVLLETAVAPALGVIMAELVVVAGTMLELATEVTVEDAAAASVALEGLGVTWSPQTEAAEATSLP